MRNIVLIDFGSVYWSAWHSSANDEVSAAHDRAVGKVRNIITRNEGAFVAVCCDSPKNWRKLVDPTYKAHRAEKDAAAVEQLLRAKETLTRDGTLLWESEGFEADDVIATAAVKAQRYADQVYIYSADKDLLQLVNPKCTVITTSNGEIFDVAEVKKKWDIAPEQIADALALMGDSSDNIPGVPGIGLKGAAKILKKVSTIEELIEKLGTSFPGGIMFSDKVDAALRENFEKLVLWKKLTTLSWSAPIDYEELFKEREIKPLTGEDDEDYLKNLDATDEEDEFFNAANDSVQAEVQQTPAVSATPAKAIDIVEEARQVFGATVVEKTPPKAPAGQPGAVVTAPAQQQQGMVPAPQQPMGLAKAGPRDNGLQPKSLAAAFDLAKAIHNSRLYSRKFASPEAIMVVIIRGSEMGLSATTSLDAFHAIDGSPVPLAHLIIARAKAHPDCKYFRFLGGDDTYAEYETHNRNNPEPTKLKFTIQQAITAGMAPANPRKQKPEGNGKDDRNQWEKRPSELLRKTCGVQLARIEYPDAALGLYAAEELGFDVDVA